MVKFIFKVCYSIINNIYLNIIKYFILMFILLNFINIPIIFAQSNLSLSTPVSNTPVINYDPPNLPCSIYDYDWGYSKADHIDGYPTSFGGSNGLYSSIGQGGIIGPAGSMNPERKQALVNLVRGNLIGGKDPIFLSYLTPPVNLLAVNGDDPILGFPSGANINLNNINFNRNIVKLPCINGNISGLIARRGGDVNTNCGRSEAFLLCDKDNQIIPGIGSSGCPINLFYDKNTLSENGQGYTGGLTSSTDNTDTAQSNSILQIIYRQGTVLKKTTDIDPSYKKFISASDLFYDKKLSPSDVQDQINYTNYSLTASTKYNGDGITTLNVDSTFKFSNNIIHTNPREDDIDQYKYLFDGNGNGTIGRWVNDSNKHIPTNLYQINKKVFHDLTKASFECKAIPVNYRVNYKHMGNDNGEQTGSYQLKLFTWIPISNSSLSSPTCDSTVTVGSTTVETTTANGKTILICTPCLPASIFRSDIFGQPVYGIPTAIGCLPASLSGLVAVILRISSMLAGGIALMIITIAGIKIAVNSDNPEEIKKSQKSISSAIGGLLVIICAVLLLNIVGLRILDLGNYGGDEITYATIGKTTP